MKYLSFILVILVFFAISVGCGHSPSKDYQLVWSDEFDNTGLPDPGKWSFDTIGNALGWGNNELQYYTFEKIENAKVENGVLTITALLEEINSKKYTSARLTTRGKGDWLYGRFEIKAKLPTGNGMWSAIWMLPSEWEYGGWPDSGEIDIMENVGFDPDTIVATAHTKSYNHKIGTQKTARIFVPTCSDEFHVYSLEWEPEEYRVYVDNSHCFTFENEHTGPDKWPFDKRFHLLLNIAVGGDWGGQKGIHDSIFPQKMVIDYVRVYQKTNP